MVYKTEDLDLVSDLPFKVSKSGKEKSSTSLGVIFGTENELLFSWAREERIRAILTWERSLMVHVNMTPPICKWPRTSFPEEVRAGWGWLLPPGAADSSCVMFRWLFCLASLPGFLWGSKSLLPEDFCLKGLFVLHMRTVGNLLFRSSKGNTEFPKRVIHYSTTVDS